MCLALYIAFWLQLDDPYWAATSAGIVSQTGLGASLRKGRFRAIGTVIGGIAIVILTAIFPQNHLALLVSLSLWGAVCGWFATILPDFGGYAAALAGYTTAIIFSGMVSNPENVFMLAVWRVTEISIGILCAQLVHLLCVPNALVLPARSAEAPSSGWTPLPHVPDVFPPLLNGLRIFLALVFAEAFWIVTEWPEGPTMITFTAVSVILFSARAEAAFASAVEFAAGCAGASVVAVTLNLAILPAVPSDFLCLALVLLAVLVPLGMLAAGSWRNAAFGAMVTNVMPILAIQNEPSYDATQVLNTAIAVFSGTALAALAIRLIPPLCRPPCLPH